MVFLLLFCLNHLQLRLNHTGAITIYLMVQSRYHGKKKNVASSAFKMSSSSFVSFTRSLNFSWPVFSSKNQEIKPNRLSPSNSKILWPCLKLRSSWLPLRLLWGSLFPFTTRPRRITPEKWFICSLVWGIFKAESGSQWRRVNLVMIYMSFNSSALIHTA